MTTADTTQLLVGVVTFLWFVTMFALALLATTVDYGSNLGTVGAFFLLSAVGISYVGTTRTYGYAHMLLVFCSCIAGYHIGMAALPPTRYEYRWIPEPTDALYPEGAESGAAAVYEGYAGIDLTSVGAPVRPTEAPSSAAS